MGAVSDVNGPIQLGAHVTAASAGTVNGPVTLREAARVSGGVETVNGAITLGPGAEVGGAVKNVNGHIVLNGAHVGGGLRTVGGDIDVLGGSHVEGGIVVEKAGWFSTELKKPRIVIGPGASVQGVLHFERPVQLYVSDKASIGAVSGATPVVFSGEQPAGGQKGRSGGKYLGIEAPGTWRRRRGRQSDSDQVRSSAGRRENCVTRGAYFSSRRSDLASNFPLGGRLFGQGRDCHARTFWQIPRSLWKYRQQLRPTIALIPARAGSTGCSLRSRCTAQPAPP